MDCDSFGAWLDAIRGMTAKQRGQGFCGLALAEATDDANMAAFASPVMWYLCL